MSSWLSLPVSPFIYQPVSVSRWGREHCKGWATDLVGEEHWIFFMCFCFFSCHRLYLILFPSLNGEKTPVFFVFSDCGLLGQGGSHKPSQSKTLWSRFFDLLLFIALVVMEWKTVYLYSNGVNLKKKVLLYKYFIFYHCINIQYWLTYVLWLQVFWSPTQWVNKKEETFLWILDYF